MSKLIELATDIAREAHAGQLYDDRDYVDAHVLPVADMIAKMGYDESCQAVGLLHDVPEESDITSKDLVKRGIQWHVAGAVELLRKKGEPHEAYLGAIATNPLAIVGKFADSSVNLANTVLRSASIEKARFDGWLETYVGNLIFLHPLLPSPDETEPHSLGLSKKYAGRITATTREYHEEDYAPECSWYEWETVATSVDHMHAARVRGYLTPRQSAAVEYAIDYYHQHRSGEDKMAPVEAVMFADIVFEEPSFRPDLEF